MTLKFLVSLFVVRPLRLVQCQQAALELASAVVLGLMASDLRLAANTAGTVSAGMAS
jgi:hypothetical protein